MTANKFLVVEKSKVLRSRLDSLTKDLQTSIKNGNLQTQESYMVELVKAINEFYGALSDPYMTVPEIKQDDYPDVTLFNDLWNALLDDLVAIFTELENIEALTVSNFNFAATESNRLLHSLKGISSKLGDYILYAIDSSPSAIYFKDSFNNLSKTDFASPLLNAEQGDINQAEGIITLPIDTSQDSFIKIKEPPVINANSNGFIGNNNEVGAVWNGKVEALFDNNPDTWFEYERVVRPQDDDGTPVILDMTINLGTAQFINHIRVNPNNFGTRSVMRITSIDTSIDGEVYVSIKDDIPTAGFIGEDEENIFSLAPSTSKFAGQGLYTFTPRKAKYIHIVLEQPDPYLIESAAGSKSRYAIGLRDIEIRALHFKSTGEFISSTLDSLHEIQKVLLRTNQTPSVISELAEIRYYISADEGSSWHEITPEAIGLGQTWRVKDETGDVELVAPEILNFNNTTASSINTSVPVKSLRLKMVLKRDDTAFTDGSYTLQKRVVSTSEPHQIPSISPFTITLERPPVDGTVVLVDPMFGSRGDPSSPYTVGYSNQTAEHQSYRLPFTYLPRPIKKAQTGSIWHTEPVPANEWAHVEVAGKEWTHISAAWSSYSSTDEVFSIGVGSNQLVFGDGTDGKTPPAGSKIDLYFDAERLFPSASENVHNAKLEFAASSNKNGFKIKRYGKIATETETLPKGSTVIQLKHGLVDSTSTMTTVMTAAGYTFVSFINGRDELTSSTNWTIDTENGIMYLGSPTPANSDLVVDYTYQPVTQLSQTDWDWSTTDLLKDSISIKESGWQTIKQQDVLSLANNTTVFDLSKLAVVAGTLKLTATSGGSVVTGSNDPFVKEVEFINGVTELGGQLTKKNQTVPTLTAGTTNTFSIDEDIVSDTTYLTTFSNTDIFTTEVGGTPGNSGEYQVNRTTNEVVVKIASSTDVTDPGTMTYYYSSPVYGEYGRYSVDYPTGRVHTQRVISSSYTVTANYEYTDFRAEYRIARRVDPKSYAVDIASKIVYIKDDEIAARAMMPHQRPDRFPPQYLINYDYVAETREDIGNIVSYFTPIVRDYAIKAIVKGKVF